MWGPFTLVSQGVGDGAVLMQGLRRLSVKHTCPRGKGQDGGIRGAFRHFPGQGCWKLTVWHSWVFRAFSRASIFADFFNDSITKAHNCNPSMAEPRDQESRCASCADGSSPSHPGRALAQTASEPCGPENTDIVERQVCVAASYMALTFCFGFFSMMQGGGIQTWMIPLGPFRGYVFPWRGQRGSSGCRRTEGDGTPG